jgi:aldose 1-epimerase
VTGAIPIHGFYGRTDQWQVVEVKQDGKAAWVTSRLDVYKQPMWMKQWPFAHTVEMTYRLEDGVLEVRTRIKNMSAEPMPVAVGYHTYYQLTDSPRPEWTVNIPARTRWLLNNVKVPTGETEPAEKLFPNGRGVLKDYMLDDVFSDLTRDAQGRAHVFLKGKQQQLEIMFGPTWNSLVIFTGGGGRGAGAGPTAAPAAPLTIAFEPMAGITNALNLAHKGLYKELQYIAPDATWEASFWIKPTGF